MNNIIKDFKEKNIRIYLKVFDKQDLANGWEIKAIIDHPEVFDIFYSKYQLNNIDDINDYYLYFLSIKLSSMSNLIEHIIDDNSKKKIEKLSKEAIDIINDFDRGKVVKYINSHIEDIFDNKSLFHELIPVTIDFIVRCLSGIDLSVIEYISSNHGHLIIDRYDKFEKIIEDNSELFDILIPSGNYNKIDPFRFDIILDIWRHILSKEKTNLKEKVNEKIPILHEDIMILIKSANEKNVIQIENIVHVYNDFLIKIQSPLANEFFFSVKTIEELSSKSIEENGRVFKIRIPVKELISSIEKQDKWQFRFLAITHNIKQQKSTGKYITTSQLDFHSENEDSILELVGTNFPKDDYYTFSHQTLLRSLASTEVGVLYNFLTDKEKLQDFIKMFLSAVEELDNTIYEYHSENILEDFKYLSAMIKEMVENINGDKELLHTICYSVSMYSCSLIEKLLRIFYLHISKNEVYVSLTHTTLGTLFNENNNYIIDIFGYNHIKNLSFFLIKSENTNVGHNIRNSLAHWSNFKTDYINPIFAIQILWLLVDVLNTIFSYTMFNKDN